MNVWLVFFRNNFWQEFNLVVFNLIFDTLFILDPDIWD